NNGLSDFSGLGAGQTDTAPTVTLDTSATGTFSETITLHSAGSNASGYSAALANQTLTITGTVAPQTAGGPIVPTDGLIGYWTGNGAPNDPPGNANNGSFGGSSADGILGQAFDLPSGGVTTPTPPAYADLGDGFSAGFWFNFNGHPDAAWDIIGQDVGP